MSTESNIIDTAVMENIDSVANDQLKTTSLEHPDDLNDNECDLSGNTDRTLTVNSFDTEIKHYDNEESNHVINDETFEHSPTDEVDVNLNENVEHKDETIGGFDNIIKLESEEACVIDGIELNNDNLTLENNKSSTELHFTEDTHASNEGEINVDLKVELIQDTVDDSKTISIEDIDNTTGVEKIEYKPNDERMNSNVEVNPIHDSKNETTVELAASEEKSKVIKFDNQEVAASVCEVCSKRVYPMEKVLLDSKCYHKTCLKCCVCGKSLNPTVVTKVNNSIFCKPHYIELFRKRGRYEDINVTNEGSSTSSSSYGFVPSSTAKNSHDVKISKDHVIPRNEVSGDEPTRNTESSIRVADATKAWGEGQTSNKSGWKKENSDVHANELQSVSSSVKVKSLTAKFETSQ